MLRIRSSMRSSMALMLAAKFVELVIRAAHRHALREIAAQDCTRRAAYRIDSLEHSRAYDDAAEIAISTVTKKPIEKARTIRAPSDAASPYLGRREDIGRPHRR